MVTNSEKRIYERIYAEIPIMFAQYTDNRYGYYGAYMYNFSKGGIYFESCYGLQQGKLISIRKTNCSAESKGRATYAECRAEVKWCREKASSDKSWFGVGVQYVEPISDPFFILNQWPENQTKTN